MVLASHSRLEGSIRIAVVHSFYSSRQPSGENRVVESEVRALLRAGHDVRLIAVSTDDLERSGLYTVASALRVATGLGRSPGAQILQHHSEVVHVHNLFPNWGTRWVRSIRAPIVATLHNFRPLCVNGMLFRDGGICTMCPDGHRWAGVRHACYRASVGASLPLAVANRHGPLGHPVLRSAGRIIVQSQNAYDVYCKSGVSPGRLAVWPNFLPSDLDPGAVAETGQARHWLCVGRLGPEKGIARLVRIWPDDQALLVVGDGQDRAEIERLARGKRIELVGMQERTKVIEAMRSAIGLVFPSVGFESFPVVYAEAMASGLPVLAWEPNSVASMVRGHGTGHSTTWSANLQEVLGAARVAFPRLRNHCRKVFDELLSEPAYVRRAEALYQDMIAASSRRS